MARLRDYAFVLLSMIVPLHAQETAGGAAGVVVDRRGKAVAGATVLLVGTIRRGAPSTLTDDRGRFLLQGFSGDWGLQAFKPSDGHPYNIMAFFHKTPGEKLPYVHVVPGKVTEGVVIRLGAKAGTIRFDITDESGAPLNVSASFTRPDMPKIGEYQTGIASEESLPLPAVPLRLRVEADGYQPWQYGGSDWQSRKGLIWIKSGKNVNLTVRLRKLQHTN